MNGYKEHVEKLRNILDSTRHFYFYDSDDCYKDIWVPMNTFANFDVYDNTADLLKAHSPLMEKMVDHVAKTEKPSQNGCHAPTGN